MTYEERMRWFHAARLGIYVHYGLYSLLGRGEWTMYSERIPAAEYAALADRFHPDPGAAREWCELAVQAGARYIVLTTKHHEGFALFDSKHSDFTSARRGCRRDIVREFTEAARECGLRVGLYFSLLDWRFPGYFEPERHPESHRQLVENIHDQVRELMTNYGRIDLLEYDGEWMADLAGGRERQVGFWRSRELNQMVRELQPGIIINNRSGLDEDLDTPEQVVRASRPGRGWECCMCIGDSCAWGYTRFNPNWKSPEQLLQHLLQAARDEGNYLVNIGPMPDGHVRGEEVERLLPLGDWIRRHEEIVRDSRRCSLIGSSQPGLVDLNLQGIWIRQGNTAYWCVFRWPGPTATAVRVGSPPRRIRLHETGRELPFEYDPRTGRLKIHGLPHLPPDPLCSVIAADFDEPPRLMPEPDKAAWL